MSASSFSRIVTVAAPVLLAFGCAACGRADPGASAPPTRPSLVLIVIDTLRADHLSWYGYAHDTSPKLGRLAQESVVFDHCLATSSWTLPSTMSLLTGLYPRRHGVQESVSAGDPKRASPQLVLLGETLQAAGYRTAAFSENPYISPVFGLDQGFDEFAYQMSPAARYYRDLQVPVDKALAWIDEQGDAPFFAYLHVMNVHGPYMADERYRARFREEPSLPFEFKSQLWEDIMTRGCAKCRSRVKPEHLRDLRAQYDGAIAWTDEVLGAFLHDLRTRGHLDRAVVVVAADHGEELFDHGGFDHGKSLHAEVVDVPLLIRPPGGTNGRRVATPVSLVDVPATLLDLLGLEGDGSEPRRVGDGLSLASFVRSEATPESLKSRVLSAEIDVPLRAKAFLLQLWPLRAITTWKDYRGRRDHFELFDVVRDPKEQVDLAPKRPNARHRLSEMTTQLQARLDAGRIGGGTLVEPSPALRERLEALGYVEEEVIGGDAIEESVEEATGLP